jgi:hypothetical protein
LLNTTQPLDWKNPDQADMWTHVPINKWSRFTLEFGTSNIFPPGSLRTCSSRSVEPPNHCAIYESHSLTPWFDGWDQLFTTVPFLWVLAWSNDSDLSSAKSNGKTLLLLIYDVDPLRYFRS